MLTPLALLLSTPAASGGVPALFQAAMPAAGSVATASYADVADLSDAATAIVRVRVRSVIAIDAERAAGTLPGWNRYYATADVSGLIRGDSPIVRRISFTYEAPVSDGKKANWKKRDLLLFGHLVPGRADQFRLTGRASALDWSAATESLVRSVAEDLLDPDSPPRITRVSSAFHVAGTVLGESETQIFLDTENGQPISLSVIRRQGMAPLLSVALGEIVDEAAGRPRPETMLWYRLACFLPSTFPDQVARAMPPAEAKAVANDYALVMSSLGTCTRTIPPAR